MKKLIFGIVIIVLAIVVIKATVRTPVTDSGKKDADLAVSSSTAPVAVTEIVKVSSKTSKFENAELGFSVNYPLAWEANSGDLGVSFIMPIDKNQVSTVAKIQADINVVPGKCTFPPVTTIKDKGTITVGTKTLNMISMSNTVQGKNYFNRMYTLQNEGVCYVFSFSSITSSPASKNLTGSNLTQAQNNNNAIINAADAEFTSMVKSFTFVKAPEGQDETKASPVK